MANMCYFILKAVGKKKDLNEFNTIIGNIDEGNTSKNRHFFCVNCPNLTTLEIINKAKNDNSIYDEKNKKYSAYSCIGVIDKSNGRRCFVVIINNIGTDELYDINTVSHEAFHITMELLNACDMQYSEDNCESYAYLQGYITECIYKTAKKEWDS